MKKVIIAIDSFKGCLKSQTAGEAAKEGLNSIFPTCATYVLPVADGGEGLLEIFSTAPKAINHTVNIHGPLMELIKGSYKVINNNTAIIESATACGLDLVPINKRNPMKTTSFGLGELIKDAIQRGYKHLIIGLGGSSTNDAGMGMLQALGYHLYDKDGILLGLGGEILNHIERIDDSESLPSLKDVHFTIACDVNTPFCGPQGAACIFAKQKGATPEMIKILDQGLQSTGQIMERCCNRSFMNEPGTGAAGGIGGCFKAFFKTELKTGIDIALDFLNFDSLICGADLVITGEGKADLQTLMGKVPFGILKRVKGKNIPVILIAGSISNREELSAAGFSGIFSITPSPMSLEEAMNAEKTKKNIFLLIKQLANLIKNTSI